MIHKFMIKITLLLAFMLMFSFGTTVSAQKLSASINGMVTDEFGRPLAGVMINDESGNAGTTTNLKGEFNLILNSENKLLIFSYDGYATQKVATADKEKIDIKLKWDAHNSDEIIQLGYTSQRRNDVSGSVSTVSGADLEKSPVANLPMSFAGRFPGLTTVENNSELSRSGTSLYIRGLNAARGNNPLVMIDGIMVAYNSAQTLDYISANEIESVTILKDASTQALYGIQGANGLMVITTKRGKKGGVQIKTTFDQSFQQATTKPTFYNSADYAEMRNQAAFNDGKGLNYLFTDAQIASYRAGDNPNYPNNNWYNQYIKNTASMQRVGINVTGGNDKVQYYSNVNFMHQGGVFNTDQTKYDPEMNNTWINYRTNVDMTLNKYLKAYVRLAGNIKRERTAGVGNATIYGSVFQIPSATYGPLTAPVLDATTGAVITPGQVITTEQVGSPTYGMLNRTGYTKATVTNITSQFGLDLDMSFLTKGLDFTGILAYQTNAVGVLYTTQDYERWLRTSNLDALVYTKKGTETNSPLAYGKDHSFYYHLTYNAKLNYKRDFGKHQVGAMAYMFYQNLTKADNSLPGLLPYNRVSSGAEATYGYDSKFLLKFDVGYSGSEQYARAARYIATPAISGAWVASKMDFMRDLTWVTLAKVRASYGQTANDQSGLARFAYLNNVTFGGAINNPTYLQYGISENQIGNPLIQAEVSTKQNIGIDLGFFNALTISVDAFKEHMSNMIVSAVSLVPQYQGVPLGNYPQNNIGVFDNKGYEIVVNYDKQINRDVTVSVGGQLSYNKNTVVKVNEAQKTIDYAYRYQQEGYSYGQYFGYLVDYSNGNGFFNTQAELTAAATNLVYGFGTPRLGDLKYQDLNKDGKIDERDKAPIGKGALPLYTYGISGGITYKQFDLSFLFQGVGQFWNVIGGQGVWETDYNGVFGAWHQNAWTQARYDNGEKITYPALSLAQTVNQQGNDFINFNKSYVRLKNVELTYTLPSKLSDAVSLGKIKIILSGQNLITWDKMKSKDFGPEGSYAAFPVYRVYNIGVNVVF